MITLPNVNPFDPNTMIAVVDVTPNVQADVLHYNLRDKDKTLQICEPDYSAYGDPTYRVPRFYAERLLQNCGGRTFRLVSPAELKIKMPNGRGGYEYKTVRAYRKREDGNWYELTDEDIAEIENADVAREKQEAAQAPLSKGRKSRKKEVEQPKEQEPVITPENDELTLGQFIEGQE